MSRSGNKTISYFDLGCSELAELSQYWSGDHDILFVLHIEYESFDKKCWSSNYSTALLLLLVEISSCNEKTKSMCRKETVPFYYTFASLDTGSEDQTLRYSVHV